MRIFRGDARPQSLATRLVLALTLVLVGATARASDFCVEVTDLIEQARSGFADFDEKKYGGVTDAISDLGLDTVPHCRLTENAGRQFYRCGWDFPLRAEQASKSFDTLAGNIAGCLGEQATLNSDRSVNHPDFYALRQYRVEKASVSVSIKDKGALGRTFVAISIQGEPSP